MQSESLVSNCKQFTTYYRTNSRSINRQEVKVSEYLEAKVQTRMTELWLGDLIATTLTYEIESNLCLLIADY